MLMRFSKTVTPVVKTRERQGAVSFEIMLLVLFAAFLHASWNAFIKLGDNTLVNITLLVTGAGVIAGACLPFVPAPARASWPFWRDR
jgi:hypothetical protein